MSRDWATPTRADHVRELAKILRGYRVNKKLVDEFEWLHIGLGPTSKEECHAIVVSMSKAMIRRIRKVKEVEKSNQYVGGKMVPRSVISAVALKLVRTSITRFEFFPVELYMLLHELLGAGERLTSEKRRPRERRIVAYLIILIPDIGVRQLSRLVGVARPTIDRWLKDGEFQADLKYFRDLMSDPRWPEMMRNAIIFAAPEAENLLPDPD